MEDESIYYKCAGFALSTCITYLLRKQYVRHEECLKSLKEADCLELKDGLKETIKKNNGTIKYAAINGKIQALGSALKSQYVSSCKGVIREKITLERKLKWNPFLGIWGSANNEILQTINCVPFALCGKSSLFKKAMSVEVLEPLTAKELVIPTIHDEFTCHHDTIGDTVFSVIRGEKTVGIQEIERLLCEKENLTAVGKLIIENGELKIKPPDENLPYFLTPLSLESLINKVNFSAKVYKVSFMIMGAVSFAFLLYFSRLAFLEVKRKVVSKRERKKFEEQRRLNRLANKSPRVDDPTIPKCIICLENSVEVVLLECGHVCLCYDCSDKIQNVCPVCRNVISRTVPAFWP